MLMTWIQVVYIQSPIFLISFFVDNPLVCLKTKQIKNQNIHIYKKQKLKLQKAKINNIQLIQDSKNHVNDI